VHERCSTTSCARANARVANHDGSRRRRGERFFDPPDENAIGTLRTASAGTDPLDLLAGAAAVPIGAVAAATTWLVTLDRVATSLAIAAGVAAGVAICTLACWVLVHERCSYIGDRGAWLAERRLVTRRRVLRFESAADVRIFTVRTELGTRVTYTWVDERRRPVFVWTASYRGPRGALPPHHAAVVGDTMVRAFDQFQATTLGLRAARRR
jgi:hypothetical protein